MAERVERVPAGTTSDDGAVVRRTSPTAGTIARRVVWYLAGILLILLAFRFVLALLGANPSNGFANFIYSASHPFVSPFFSLFNYNTAIDSSLSNTVRSRFEIYTLIAMAVYAVIAWIIGWLFTLGRPDTADRV
jgi:hypothetical protein